MIGNFASRQKRDDQRPPTTSLFHLSTPPVNASATSHSAGGPLLIPPLSRTRAPLNNTRSASFTASYRKRMISFPARGLRKYPACRSPFALQAQSHPRPLHSLPFFVVNNCLVFILWYVRVEHTCAEGEATVDSGRLSLTE